MKETNFYHMFIGQSVVRVDYHLEVLYVYTDMFSIAIYNDIETDICEISNIENEMDKLIGQRIIEVVQKEHKYIMFEFDHNYLSVLMHPENYRGPEAIFISDNEDNMWVIR